MCSIAELLEYGILWTFTVVPGFPLSFDQVFNTFPMCSTAELLEYRILWTFTVVPGFPLSLTLLALSQIVGSVLISNYILYIIILGMGSPFSR